MRHCVETIRDIIASGRDDRRAVLQIGYNLGRLSELTGLGREPFWDAWKGAIDEWDRDRLVSLASELPEFPDDPEHSDRDRRGSVSPGWI